MQIVDIDLMIRLLYGIINILVLVPTAWIVYRNDRDSNINKGMAFAMLSGVIAFVNHTMRVLVWSLPLYDLSVFSLLKRAEYFSIVVAASLFSWSLLQLRDGEALWNQKRSILHFTPILTINLFAILTPDAFTILPTPEGNFPQEGLLFSIIFYPSLAGVAMLSIIVIGSTYMKTKDDDPSINRQITRLAVSASFLIFGVVAALVRAIYIQDALNSYYGLAFTTIGLVILTSGFSQETSLIKVKILGSLNRLSRSLAKGNTGDAEKHLRYLSSLIEEEKVDVSIIKIRILEALMEVYQRNLDNAMMSLESAKQLAELHGIGNGVTEINRHLEELRERRFEMEESKILAVNQQDDHEISDLKIALSYLDEIIQHRKIIDRS